MYLIFFVIDLLKEDFDGAPKPKDAKSYQFSPESHPLRSKTTNWNSFINVSIDELHLPKYFQKCYLKFSPSCWKRERPKMPGSANFNTFPRILNSMSNKRIGTNWYTSVPIHKNPTADIYLKNLIGLKPQKEQIVMIFLDLQALLVRQILIEFSSTQWIESIRPKNAITEDYSRESNSTPTKASGQIPSIKVSIDKFLTANYFLSVLCSIFSFFQEPDMCNSPKVQIARTLICCADCLQLLRQNVCIVSSKFSIFWKWTGVPFLFQLTDDVIFPQILNPWSLSLVGLPCRCSCLWFEEAPFSHCSSNLFSIL